MYESPPPSHPPSRPVVRVVSGCLLMVFLCSTLYSAGFALENVSGSLMLIVLVALGALLVIVLLGTLIVRRR